MVCDVCGACESLAAFYSLLQPSTAFYSLLQHELTRLFSSLVLLLHPSSIVWNFNDHFREKGVGDKWTALPEHFKVRVCSVVFSVCMVLNVCVHVCVCVRVCYVKFVLRAVCYSC